MYIHILNIMISIYIYIYSICMYIYTFFVDIHICINPIAYSQNPQPVYLPIPYYGLLALAAGFQLSETKLFTV